MNEYPHYFRQLPPGCTHIDVYRVLSLFEVSDPALQHAVKKLLCAGARGAKDQGQDIAEAIATLQRWQHMRAEEAQTLEGRFGFPPMRMILCEICGNKRCPHAEDKCMQCTGSNEPGQVGVPIEQPAEPTLRDDVNRIRAVFAELPREHLDAAMDWMRSEREEDPPEFGPVPDPSSDPVAEGFRLKAERGHVTYPAAAPEDAERAAYLARWKDAPEWANFITQGAARICRWWEFEPTLVDERIWEIEAVDHGRCIAAGFDRLGSVRCEPRPVPADGQGVGP